MDGGRDGIGDGEEGQVRLTGETTRYGGREMGNEISGQCTAIERSSTKSLAFFIPNM